MTDKAAGDDTESTAENDTESDADIDPATVLDELGDQPVLLFDGVCNLCNGTIQWLIPRDPDAVLAFAPLQSPVGTAVQERYGLDPDDLDSVLLVDGGLYTKSTATIPSPNCWGGRTHSPVWDGCFRGGFATASTISSPTTATTGSAAKTSV